MEHAAREPWLNGRRWDLTWIVGSALVVPLGLVAVWAGASSFVVNLTVTALVGGPHLFSTFFVSYFDPGFQRSHRAALVAVSVLIPAFVVAMTLVNFQVLLSLFIFAASLHVLLQCTYLADAYRRRAGDRDGRASRFIDYGVILLSFYPIASYRLVRGEFLLGDVPILIPEIFRTELTCWAVSTAFGFCLVAWLGKTFVEWRRGTLNAPKSLLIVVTVTVTFVIPAMESGARLELVFQAVNAWHSIQYLGLVWVVLKMRKELGCPTTRSLARVSGPGPAAWRFYGLCVLFAMGLFGGVVAVSALDPLRLSFDRYYYMGILSALLIHYALDGYFFVVSNRPAAQPDRIPLATPSAG